MPYFGVSETLPNDCVQILQESEVPDLGWKSQMFASQTSATSLTSKPSTAKLRIWTWGLQEWPRQSKPKKGQFMNFHRGIPVQKLNVSFMLVFLRKKTPQNSQKKWAKCMNFSFWPFLWFGLPGRLLRFSGRRIPFCATGALWGHVTSSRLFLDDFCKHLSSVLGRTELCHEVRNPGPP